MKQRHIKETFLNVLKSDSFKPIIDIIRVDPSLDLELRGDSVMVYYRGGRILTITEPLVITEESQKDISKSEANELLEGISSEYMKDKSLSMYFIAPKIDNIDIYFANAKHLVDEHEDKNGHKLGEKEIQQRVIAENNYSINADETEFFIADMEWQDNDSLKGRADIVAFYWGHMSHKKKILTMYLIEVKQGHHAIKTTKPNTKEEGPGLLKHYHDFIKFKQSEEAVKDLKTDMLEVLRQKTDLGLIEGLNELFDKDENGKLTTTGIEIHEDVEFVFLLANYLHFSKQLHHELSLLPDNAQFFCSSFVGYGLYKKFIVNKNTLPIIYSLLVNK